MSRNKEHGVTARVSGDEHPRASPRAVTALAWLLCSASLTLGVVGLVLESLNGHRITDSEVLGIVLLAITFPLVGAVVAARRPRNPLGWIFCAIGIAYGLTVTGEAYALYTLDTAPGALPGGELMSWLGNWAWAPGLGLLITFALLLFPNGRLPSPRWRPVAWLSATSIALICGPGAVWSWPRRGLALLASDQEGLENAPRLVPLLVHAGLPLMLLCGLASVVALLVRFRRSRGVERQQLKWFAFAGAVTVAGLVLVVTPSQYGLIGPLNALVALPVLVSMPVAAGIAILRYRLYEIDWVINRTLVYGLLTVLLGAVYAVGVFGLGRLLNPVTGESGLAVAASTLAVAALFQPARHRVQAVVDRRFNRRRYDATKTVAAFSTRLRDQVALDTLSAELLRVVDQTMQPTTVSLWLSPSPHMPRRNAGRTPSHATRS
jgi:MFS family permease